MLNKGRDWLLPKILMVVILFTVGSFLGYLLVYGTSREKSGTVSSSSPSSYVQGATGSSLAGSHSLLPGNPNIFVELAKKIVPSVVNISTVTRVKGFGGTRGGQDDLFRKFFEDFFRGMPPGERGGRPSEGLPKATSLGTGFIIDAEGLILTNNHVVAEADEIKIRFTEDEAEKPTDGEVVGRDPLLDLALVKVKNKKDLVPVQLGNSEELQVGEYVIAVGNPFGQGHSVTHGIISAKDRKAPDFALANYLQTDAPINPGNSGGPLVNLKGEVVGINNAIDARAQGIGFAIPINLVKDVLPQLKTKGSVARGYIGVLIDNLTPQVAEMLKLPKDLRAPFVSHVYPGEPADKAGVEPYDAILEFDGKQVRTKDDLIRAVTAVPVGKSVQMKVNRAGKEKNLKIKVTERPDTETFAKKQPRDKDDQQDQSYVGMTVEEVTPQTAEELGLPKKTKGLVVLSLSYDGPAARAGLMRGDVIVEVDRKAVDSVEDFFKIVKEKKSYLLRVLRPGPKDGAYLVVVLDLAAK